MQDGYQCFPFTFLCVLKQFPTHWKSNFTRTTCFFVIKYETESFTCSVSKINP